MKSDPLDGKPISYEHLSKLPSPRILMMESLGVAYTKERVPVKTSQHNLGMLIDQAKDVLLLVLLPHLNISHLLAYANKIGKKVALDGYGMKMNVKIAQSWVIFSV